MNQDWTKLHGIILNEIFSELSSSNIEWLVIRNYQGLPWVNCSKDVDIAVKKEEWDNAEQIIQKTLFLKNFIYYDLKRYQYILCYTFFDHKGNGFKIDLFDRNEYCGLTTHTFVDLNTCKIKTNEGVFGSCNLHNAIIVFLRPLLGGGVIKEKYIPEIIEFAADYSKKFEHELSRIITPKVSKQICIDINQERIKSTIKYRKKLQYYLFINNIRKYGFRTIGSILNHYYSTAKVRIKMFNTTPFLSVLGPDGAGKSTFIDALIQKLSTYYCADATKVHLYHHRPTLLPNLGVVGESTKIMKADTDFTNPHRGKPTGFFSSYLRMTYYWMDYLIGGTIMRIKDVNSDRITLYDRYIYDFLIDPKRSRIYLPFWIRKLFSTMVIQPRIVFILQADAEVIYKRKQELTLTEIRRQLNEFEILAKSGKRFILIDANRSPCEMVDQAMQIIFDKFVYKKQL